MIANEDYDEGSTTLKPTEYPELMGILSSESDSSLL